MSIMITLEVPEESLLGLKTEPDNFGKELAMLATVKLYELGRLSSGRAAQLVGLSRVEFLLALGQYQVSPFQLDEHSLAQDVANA